MSDPPASSLPLTCSFADQRETNPAAGSNAATLQISVAAAVQKATTAVLDRPRPQAEAQIAVKPVTRPSLDAFMEHPVHCGLNRTASGASCRGPAIASGAGTTSDVSLSATTVSEALGGGQPQVVQSAGTCPGAQVPFTKSAIPTLDDEQNERAAKASDAAYVGHAARSEAEPQRLGDLSTDNAETQKMWTSKRGAASKKRQLAGGIEKVRQTRLQVRSVRKCVVDSRLHAGCAKAKKEAAAAADVPRAQISASRRPRNPGLKASAGTVQEKASNRRAANKSDPCAERNSTHRLKITSIAGSGHSSRPASNSATCTANTATWNCPPVAPRARSSEVFVGARIVRVRCIFHVLFPCISHARIIKQWLGACDHY